MKYLWGNMWEKMKECWGDTFLIVTAGWVLAHLILIEICGVVQITESNQWILYAEIVLITGLLILGVERLIKDLRRE